MFSKKIWLIFAIQIVLYAFVLQEGEGLKYLINASSSSRHISHFLFLFAFFITGLIGCVSFREKWIVKLWLAYYISVFLAISFRNIIYYFLNLPLAGNGIFLGGLREFSTSPLPFGICLILIYLGKEKQNKIKIR